MFGFSLSRHYYKTQRGGWMNRTGREVRGRGSCTSCLWLTSTSWGPSWLRLLIPLVQACPLVLMDQFPGPNNPGQWQPGDCHWPVTQGSNWEDWGSSTMLIINSKDTFSLNSCPVVIQRPQASWLSPLSCCQPSEVFSGRGKAQPYNLPAQKQSWHKCTWPTNWKGGFFQSVRPIWTHII